ncbi:unnamed protein product [Scytosiphon promiscuus]
MWKPDVVVPEHRYRARIVWTGLLVSITAYTIWQLWKIFDELQNPSTRLEITDELYTYPYVLMCFFHGRGCGYEDQTVDACVADSFENASVFFDGDFSEEDIITEGRWSNCVGFDLTKHDVEESGVSRDEAIAEIYTYWDTTDIASTESGFFNNIAIFIAEEEPTEESLAFLYVPYTRHLADDDQFELSVAELTIGMTTKKDLRGDVTTSYPPLILSSSTYTTANTLDQDAISNSVDLAIGSLYLQIRQGVFSRTEIEELDPLDVGTFLGNVGGFWELLIIFWGLIFIATRENREPELKARNFAKSIRTGTEIVQRRRRSGSVDVCASASRAEERPQWEDAYGGSRPNAAAAVVGSSLGGGATADEITAAVGLPMDPPADGGKANAAVATRRASNSSDHQRTVDGSSSVYRRPVVQDAPRRGSRSNGASSARHSPAPPSYEAMAAV